MCCCGARDAQAAELQAAAWRAMEWLARRRRVRGGRTVWVGPDEAEARAVAEFIEHLVRRAVNA